MNPRGAARAGVVACVCLGLLVAPGAALAEPPHAQEVDPFIGTADEGNAFPGATTPFGMVQWSPDTRYEPGGYEYHDSVIQDFSLTHLSGAGCVAYQDIPILPTDQPVTASPGNEWSRYASGFAHKNESASPGYYAVRLEPSGTQVELAATPRTGFGRFRFPQTATANVLLNASGSVLPVSEAAVEVIGNSQLAGHVSAGGFCGGQHSYTLYFAAQFDRPFDAFGTWTDAGLAVGGTSASGPQAGAYVAFDARQNPLVQLKVGLSFVSVANAQLNLQREDPGWDFAAVRGAASAAWEEQLGRVQVEGGSPAQRKTFYTALYHAFLHPNVFSDANGEYPGFDDQVHIADGYEHYANFSGWDIYRTQVPLLAWLAPRQASDMLRSLVVDAQQGGALPRWPLANDETGTMAGDPSALIIASAYAFGADHLDLDAAWQAIQWGADWAGARARQYEARPGLRDYVNRGYVAIGTEGVRGAAATGLEYANADFAIARLAEARGDEAARARYMWRAQSWEHLFDPDSGFLHPRTSNGTFLRGFEPEAGTPAPGGEQIGFLEGDTAQYTWMVPFNVQALILAMGGPAETTRRLDAFFDELNAGPIQPHAWMGNEPSFGVPWLFAFTGAPSHTQAVVHRIRNELFAAAPHGLPGNDDLGATSAWYVWSALGLYPAIPGVGGFVIGSPLFRSVVVHTGGGPTLRIVAQGGGPYVGGLRLNGAGYGRTWLPLDALQGDAVLQFTLSAKPEGWGSGPDAAPPSFSEGERPAIGFSSIDLEEVRLTPGQTRRFTLGVRNVSPEATTVAWSVDPPEGLWLEPARGILRLPGGAAGTVELAMGATEDGSLGCGLLSVSLFSLPDGMPLPGPVIGVSGGACE